MDAALTRANSYFPTVYEPTVFENYVHGMRRDSEQRGGRVDANIK